MTDIVSVNEKPRKGKSQGLNREYTRTFEVQMTDGFGSEALAIAAIGVINGMPHPDDNLAVAYDADADQQDDVCFWIVVIQYKTFGRSAAEEERWTQPDPRLRKPRVSFGWESMRVPAPTDRNGRVVRNSAGRVPTPRPEGDADDMVYHVSHAVNPLPNWVDEYRSRTGVVNDAPFKITFENGQTKTIETGCAALKHVRAGELQIENGIPFFPLGFDLLHRDRPLDDPTQEGWAFDLVDADVMEKDEDALDPEIGIACPLKPIQGKDGQNISDSWLLDGRGFAVKESSGAWSGGTAYENRDVVTVSDVEYVCIDPNTGNNPPSSPTKWRKLPIILYSNLKKAVDFRILPGCSAP